MVLVLFADAREVANDLDTEVTEELCVSDAGPLEDLRGAERARAEDNHLASFHDRLVDLTAGHAVTRRYIRDTDGLVVCIEEHAGNASVAAQVEIVLNILDAVHVG